MARLPLTLPLTGITFETAVSALAADPGFVALDARRAGPGGDRHSIVASSPLHRFSSSGAFVTIDGHTVVDSPRTALEVFLTAVGHFACDPYLPFSGGAIGFIGFEGARALAGAEPAKGFSRFPQCSFGIYPTAVVFDHLEGTAFVVANGTAEAAADQAAEELRERLQRASVARAPSPRAGISPQEIRLAPDGKAFERLVDEAFSWLRSDALSRIHLARHAVAPSQGHSAVAAFLSGSEEGATQALFTHEGAAAIVSSHDVLLEVRSRGAHMDPLRALVPLLPAAAFTGSPRREAISFLSEHEPTHRHFYGGAFGVIDARGLCFRTIHRSLCHADGTISITAGVDLTPAVNPRQAAADIAQRLAAMDTLQ